MQPAERVEAGLASLNQCLRPWSVSRLNVALKDSASALSALEPITLIDWRTPTWRQASAKVRLMLRGRCA
ncbi:hypothetical protein ACWEQC_08340 [Streptomyces shenzhenensis]